MTKLNSKEDEIKCKEIKIVNLEKSLKDEYEKFSELQCLISSKDDKLKNYEDSIESEKSFFQNELNIQNDKINLKEN